jgi:hypothetical protein
MTYAFQITPPRSLALPACLAALGTGAAVPDVLSEALGPRWCVQKEVDYEGEVSIIVLPADDDVGPVFILWQTDDQVHVATVRDDKWEARESHSSIQTAVSDIVSETAYLSAGMQAVG